MLRRKMLAEQLQEENDQIRQESSRDPSEQSIFRTRGQDSSGSDSSEEDQKQPAKSKKARAKQNDVELLEQRNVFQPGQFKQGKGDFTMPNGTKYSGDWVNDRMHGEGVLTRTDGRRYEGSFVDGKPDGFGVQMWQDGTIHAGTWKEGKQHGIGNYTSNGRTRQGEWENGKRVKWLKDIDQS